MNDIPQAFSKGVSTGAGQGRILYVDANVVLADRMIHGRVLVEDGIIVSIEENSDIVGPSDLQIIDCAGDVLMPGMVELHTDNIEKHMLPRPGAFWPPLAATVAHDMQIIGAGITTVYDAIAVGAYDEGKTRLKMLGDICVGLEQALEADVLKSQHILHLRCEVSFDGLEETLEPLIDRDIVGMVSIMDHTPGQRQFTNEGKYREYYQQKHGLTDDQMVVYMQDRKRAQALYSDKNRAYAVARAQGRGLAIASHDDATAAHVAEAVRDKMTIAEFPTTVEAARASHENGLAVLMGAPNIVRGGSHSGNIAARELAELGLLDIISSDYAPASLLHAVFHLTETVDSVTLPDAVRMVTKTPAAAAGLLDRGELAVGKKADLLRVRDTRHHPVVMGVWRDGQRVC